MLVLSSWGPGKGPKKLVIFIFENFEKWRKWRRSIAVKKEKRSVRKIYCRFCTLYIITHPLHTPLDLLHRYVADYGREPRCLIPQGRCDTFKFLYIVSSICLNRPSYRL